MSYPLNSNIIISGNSIDHGIYNNGSSNITYTYDQSLWSFGSSIITENTFLNPSPSSNMLNITDGSCIIRNNKFIRNGTLINSYITHHYSDGYRNSGIDEITDNIFDSSDIGDGYTTELVKGLNPGTIYTRNRNQTGKIFISLSDVKYGQGNGITLEPASIFQDTLTAQGGTLTGFRIIKKAHNLISEFQPAAANTDPLPTTFTALKGFNLSEFLEKGMSIVDVTVGGYLNAGNITSFSPISFFGLNLKCHDPVSSMDATKWNSATIPNSIIF